MCIGMIYTYILLITSDSKFILRYLNIQIIKIDYTRNNECIHNYTRLLEIH